MPLTNAERQKRHRDRKRKAATLPAPEAAPAPVTSSGVTGVAAVTPHPGDVAKKLLGRVEAGLDKPLRPSEIAALGRATEAASRVLLDHGPGDAGDGRSLARQLLDDLKAGFENA